MDRENKNTQNFHRKDRFPVYALIVSLGGVSLFYLVPFIFSFVYAVVNNPIQMRFVGLENFRNLFQNKYFILGLKNTLTFMLFAIPLSILCSFGLSIALKRLRRWENALIVVFLIPLVLPSATMVQFWQRIFRDDGIINRFLGLLGIDGPFWMSSEYAMVMLVIIYIWKNVGYYMVLFLTGLYSIPEYYYDCAEVFGAKKLQILRYVTLPYMTPSFYLVLVMSFVNCFKIFREVYLLEGEFPPSEIYLLQHFINSTLLSMHYDRLVCAVYVLTALIVLVVTFGFRAENSRSDYLCE